VSACDGSYVQEFDLGAGRRGANVVGFVRGTATPERYIVVTAHFDHLGVQGGELYPGADDNASGAAGLLEIARFFARSPARHSLIFAGFDAEEIGLQGARAFVARPPVPLDRIALNVNLDMIGRNEADELYAAGTHHYPFLADPIRAVAARSDLTILIGHDRPNVPGEDDWTGLSDHAAFHRAGIPFIYFGEEDHPDYHRPTDTFERIDPGFLVAAVKTVIDLLLEVDAG
jgi:Zn-dependent M28 family amino/carboxypeptidase